MASLLLKQRVFIHRILSSIIYNNNKSVKCQDGAPRGPSVDPLKNLPRSQHFAVLSVVSHKLRLIFICCRCSLILGAMCFHTQIDLEPTYFLKERLFRDSEFIL